MAPTVIVIGLGGMGSAAAASLAQRGCRVIGVERYWPTHDRGSSHGESRVIRLAYFSDPAHVPFAQEAYPLWQRLERDSGTELVTPCDAVIVGPEGGEEVTASTTVADQLGQPYELLTPSEVTKRWSTLTPPPGTLTFLDHSQGVIRPEAAVSANLALAARNGAELHFDTAVESWSAGDSGVTVTTSAGEFTADHLVITPGAWASDILAAPGIPMEIGRLVQVWVRPAADLSLFAVDRHPRFALEDEAGRVASGFALLPGHSLVKVAFIKGPDASTPTTPDTFRREASAAEVESVIDYMGRLIPSLRGQEAERARGCIYAKTPDDNFVIGPHPEHENVTIGAAFSVHGFKFVPVVGEILADLALDGRSDRDINVFSPLRFQDTASSASAQ
ncbi:N-methyl-L-tryptophan oxidase [Pseudonocardia ailaonensis]|uniref:N-methyl-L-tryptophan oxidase n=1 Tax=Pseudonocardia ailaonensis TaxID=367279 RepID=A0ABN2N9G8_9PSEU